ncbi:YtxH domain-containing protein [Dictyobacter aurantiacus]|uniref:YtxH domain-containing protein n=1 Tax=Dictyobacter aurantiacus TaxID=1936993 RepID=A0A401ZQ06_9CHLR|nr:YtxH domain-containing protein [Dictyobacter aurantiacus]GCE08864.1 hypothetical protein KDAU_61930 [Dictyobacter aurantiacus]
MGKFLQGLFFGTAIGLLIAPMRGEELRGKLQERFKQLQERASNSKLGLSSTDTSGGRGTTQSQRQRGDEPITLPLNNTPPTNKQPSPMSSQAAPSGGASTQSTTHSRLYKYESTPEEMDYEPLNLPVETFEEIKAGNPEHERAPKRTAPPATSTENPDKNLSHQSRHNTNTTVQKNPGNRSRQH